MRSEAEKAAEEWVRDNAANLDIEGQCITADDVERLSTEDRHVYWAAVRGFLAGLAWAAPKWIKCSEKPPPDEEVLVVWNGTVCSGWYSPEYGDLRACWEISGRNLPVTDLAEVTHWMLKPAAPEVEKK